MLSSPPRRSTSLRYLAFACAALLGCTTVRAPVSTIAPIVPVHDGRPEPQLELWLEGNRAATPEESAKASAQARAALEEALDGRVSDSPDELLVVRVQGVTRTPARRSDQHAAIAGIVVGAVVIVAAVVILIVASSKGGGGGKGPSLGNPGLSGIGHGGSAGHVARAAPAAVPHALPRFRSVPAPAGLPGRGPRPMLPPVAGRPHHHAASATVGVYVDLNVPIAPAPPAPPDGYLAAQPPPQRPPGLDQLPPDAVDASTPPDGAADAEAAAPEQPPELAQLELPPPPALAVANRGFFAGDSLVLEAIVVDRATGRARWQKLLERKVDPRDRKAMKAAVDDLLGERGWVPAQ